MESIKKIFKIGNGPSSSHTIGPRKAALMYKNIHQTIDNFRVTLFGSLAATGKGHLTDKAIIEALAPATVEIIFKPEIYLEFHPNALKFESLVDGDAIDEWVVYSIGGGEITDGSFKETHEPIYNLSKMSEILAYCKEYGKTFWEYVQDTEESDLWDYLNEVWKVMKEAVERGIDTEGTLPGGLNLPRKASSYYVKAKSFSKNLKRRSLLFAYSLAVAEENAAGGRIVTAPTCGSCGVLPGVLYLLKYDFGFTDNKILKAIATAGLIGNLIKTNASISGARVGCQGEIGAACSMAAASAAQVFGGTITEIEYAAEIGLEHHLGLTCDPIGGLVQVPCIERNPFAAARALDASTFAIISDGRHFIPFDKIVETMNKTGHDIPHLYKETSLGGLAVSMNYKMKI